jgi:hypothetical protein
MYLRSFIMAALTAFFVACGGGGGNSGTQPGQSNQPPVTAAKVGSIELLLSANSIPSTSSSIVLSAIVKSDNNVGMPAQTVTFSADSGNLAVPSGVTDGNGVATASIAAGSNKTNRDIRVTVSAGDKTAIIVIPVTGSRVQITSQGSIQAAGTQPITVKLVDSGGLPVSGQTVSVTSQLGNSISNSGAGVTDGSGVATFIYTANVSGTDTLVATGLGANDRFNIFVSNIDFSAVSPSANTSISVNTSQLITFRYRVGGSGVSGQNVTFTSSRGVLSASSGITNGAGEVSVNISSTGAGSANIIAQISGVGQVSLPVQFIATTPSSVAVQANPGAVPPNLNGSVNQATIEAIVRDSTGNVVSGRQVNFTFLADESGSSFSQPSAVTDLNGRAAVQFISGANSSSSNGVIIRAQVANTSVAGTTALTVSGQSLFISIGFGNVISNADPQTYKKDFNVYVTDANGAAVSNKQVTIRAIPTLYEKGILAFNGNVWAKVLPTIQCPNEDTNLNGSINPGEDINGNGSLEPGNVAVVSPPSLVTDSSGLASFSLLYGEQYAPWLALRLEARTTVSGTESIRSIIYSVEGLAADFTNQDIAPAGVISPFGRQLSCTNPN